MRELTTGKRRGLQQCATTNGGLAVLALDHRNNLRRALQREKDEIVPDETLITFKREITRILSPSASAVLLDPEYSAFQTIAGSDLPGSTGLIVAVEATGYAGDSEARESRILDGWSVRQAKRMGASGLKLLVYYHPDASTARDIEALVAQVAEDCQREDIALFLEPLSYALVPDETGLHGDERRHVVLETARRLTPLGVDILKAEFPLDTHLDQDESAWRDACAELSSASLIPWILLSASVDFNTFLRQVRIACENGASGVAAGRAVWKEASDLSGIDRSRFLHGQARQRMRRLVGLCDALARPWVEFFTVSEPGATFYASYG